MVERPSTGFRFVLELVRDIILIVFAPVFVPMLWFASLSKHSRLLVWGHTPIINNKYWSAAMKEAGYRSITLMETVYGIINEKRDFDLYFRDIYSFIPHPLHKVLEPWLVMLFLARHAGVLHMPFDGGAFKRTRLWRFEHFLFSISKVKTVILPYGADVYIYSRIFDPSIRHALLLSYPDAGRKDRRISEKVDYWVKHADVIVMGFTLEGIPRWDIAVGNMLSIDTNLWRPKQSYSKADGKNGAVKLFHNPNHTGVKGSEFILEAVRKLEAKGLKINLNMVQGIPNKEINDMLKDSDIHVDQLILPGYGMAAVEAMASGLPVMANLSDRRYTQLFDRYSFLSECPIVATTPENIVDNLETLVRSPRLREALGTASRAYVEKYHSFEAAQYLFGRIYDKILCGNNVDLMNLFHPVKSSYNSRHAKVTHPLVDHHLPRQT